MTYFTFGALCLLAERSPKEVQGNRLVLRFPTDGSVYIGGQEPIQTQNGAATVPLSALKEGENTVRFRTGGKEWRTEGILRRQKTLSPCGISEEERFCALLDERQKLLARLDALEKDVAAYARKALFA